MLVECENPIEVTGVRTLLEAQGIGGLAQGEHQSYSVGGLLSATVQPRVMVGVDDLEGARALLSGQAEQETTGEPLEGGLCPVHEVQAIASCARCGTFLCATCRSVGAPPVCESCLEVDQLPARRAPSSPRAFFVLLGLVLALILLRGLTLT